jgi:ABC-type multidrug transport system fused ATPase/permease subunit
MPLKKSIISLWKKISIRRKTQFYILLLLIVCTSILELLSIGSVVPLINILLAPDNAYNNNFLKKIFNVIQIKEPVNLLVPFLVGFGFLIFITNLIRLVVVWWSAQLTSAVGAELALSVYKKTLYQPYVVHTSRNSSEILSIITGKIDMAVHAIAMALNLISTTIMLSLVIIVLVIVDPKMAIAIFLILGTTYLSIVLFFKNKVEHSSKRIASESIKLLKVLQEGLGGIRDVILDGTQEIYCRIFHQADLRARRAKSNIEIISSAPRYVVETVGIFFILVIAYFSARNSAENNQLIPILGALVLGAQRMLPILQSGYTSWTGLKGSISSLNDAIFMLDQNLPEHYFSSNAEIIPFEKEINLINVSFKYHEKHNFALNAINLKISKGSRIGIIGKTGSGKSTLIDLIMGLLDPMDGLITIDSITLDSKNLRGWQKQIAHVPQSIYLADLSIKENIAFGVPNDLIDFKMVQSCADKAQLKEFIDSLQENYNTKVGEKGVQLSGGQRQRIGIARALYKNAKIIIFDEATSALDDQTEAEIINTINDLEPDLTIIMIAHRITSLKDCNKIIEVKDGLISGELSYEDLVINRQFNENLS